MDKVYKADVVSLLRKMKFQALTQHVRTESVEAAAADAWQPSDGRGVIVGVKSVTEIDLFKRKMGNSRKVISGLEIAAMSASGTT